MDTAATGTGTDCVVQEVEQVLIPLVPGQIGVVWELGQIGMVPEVEQVVILPVLGQIGVTL